MKLRAVSIGECMIELTGSNIHSVTSTPAGFGGDTLNTAAYLVKALGEHGRVDYVTGVGVDRMSVSMVESFSRLGIGVEHIVNINDALPGVYLIETTSDGERTFRYWRRDSAATRIVAPEHVKQVQAAIQDADLVYVSGISLAILDAGNRETLLQMLKEFAHAGGDIAFDLNHRPALWSASDALHAVRTLGPSIRYALPSVEDDQLMRGGSGNATEVGEFWRGIGVNEVVVKNGAQGVQIHDGKSIVNVAPRATIQAVDTTAAGDSFNAAYLGARLRSQSAQDAAIAGHTLAGQVIAHHGALVESLLS